MTTLRTLLLFVCVAVLHSYVVHVLASDLGKCANDMDFAGRDIYNFQAASSDTCFTRCARNANCNACTWTNYQGGTCWMKSSAGQLRVALGARSCVWGSFTTGITSCDMPSNDIGTTPVSPDPRSPCGVQCNYYAPQAVRAATRYQNVCYCKSKVVPCVYKQGTTTLVVFS